MKNNQVIVVELKKQNRKNGRAQVMKNMVLSVLILLGSGVVTVSPVKAQQDNAAPAGEEKTAPEAVKKQGAEIKPQTTCPVMGGAIDKNLYVDYNGKRVYMCCKGCEGALKKDPEKYIKKLEAEGVTLAKIQTTCPVMGGDVDKALYVDHNGKCVYVCCEGCIGAVKADPSKYIKKLEDGGVALDLAGDAGKQAEQEK